MRSDVGRLDSVLISGNSPRKGSGRPDKRSGRNIYSPGRPLFDRHEGNGLACSWATKDSRQLASLPAEGLPPHVAAVVPSPPIGAKSVASV